jgi:hypothetical protein
MHFFGVMQYDFKYFSGSIQEQACIYAICATERLVILLNIVEKFPAEYSPEARFPREGGVHWQLYLRLPGSRGTQAGIIKPETMKR